MKQLVNLLLEKVLMSTYQIVESVLQAAIGYSPVVQLFCAVIKRSPSGCHVSQLQLEETHKQCTQVTMQN